MPEINVDKNYIDGYGIKKFVTEGLIDKFFEDVDVDLRTTSMIGYTSEMITNITEDSLNTASVLFREAFPNRAQLDESIYSFAALYQLDDVFSVAAQCKFLLAIEEDSIISNMKMRGINDSNTGYFYIDKNTTIFVEETPFTFDYDIEITVVKKLNEDGEDYIFSARYITDGYTNSISDINDQYIKIRRSNNGIIALELVSHQCVRTEVIENIIISNEVNYPIIDIEYEGKLAGFDILYKSPKSNVFEPMQKLIAFSQPLKNPFCYYQSIQDDKIRITFNSRDTYFIPEFNSEVKVILYNTEGVDGNFDVYNGTNISVIPNNEVYSYSSNFVAAAKPIGASKGGQNQRGIETLKALAVEGFRTNKALTTDNDLQLFFNNYRFRYGDVRILFLKKRDDVYERVYSAFMIVNNGDFVYKTTTLNLLLNLYDMINTEKDVFIIEPGTLFSCNDANGYAEFIRDNEKNKKYKEEYNLAIQSNTTNFITEDIESSDAPGYLKRACSFAQFKSRKGYDDTLKIWDLDRKTIDTFDNPNKSKFLIMNPFLIKFNKSPNLVTTYMTFVDNISSLDFTNQNVNMYLKFTMYTLYMSRKFGKEKKYEFKCTITPTMPVDDNLPLIKLISDEGPENKIYNINNRFNLKDNDLRVILSVNDGSNTICFSEMIPESYDDKTGNITFKSVLYTDDHISSSGKLRLLSGEIYRDNNIGDYYELNKNDGTKYTKYNKNNEIVDNNVSVDTVTPLINNKTLTKFTNIINTTSYDDIFIPGDDVIVKIHTLYKRNYYSEDGNLSENLSEQTNHPFMEYDTKDIHGNYEEYDGYIWTNEYATTNEPMTFIKALTSVRSYLGFLDHTSTVSGRDDDNNYKHDIMDAELKSIPFIRAKLVYDEKNTSNFFNVFYKNYIFMQDIISNKLRNQTGLDIKFYNTYGRSNNFIIGDTKNKINTVNIKLSFDMWFLKGTDTISLVPEVKRYIKKEIESVNNKGMNSLHISNLIRKVENTFSFVDHIIFKQINDYNSSEQSITNYVEDLNELSVEERRWYVPEMLVCDIEDIEIVEYFI